MSNTSADATVLCKHCHETIADDAVVLRHSLFDPLLVSECPNCGSTLSVGPHPW